MSRSNPTDTAVNPSTRFFEWKNGGIRYYDKTKKEAVSVPGDFTFILLDQLGSVRGWHERSKSGIYSNEVRDTRQDALLVKSFKGGEIAHGLYGAIKDRVNAAGGKFSASLYIAFKDANGLALGNLSFKGGALNAWIEFTKANRDAVYQKGVRITGYLEDKKGGVVYRVPVFKLVDISEATNALATELDKTLQTFLTGYLKRNKSDQTTPEQHLRDEDVIPDAEDYTSPMPDDDQIPF